MSSTDEKPVPPPDVKTGEETIQQKSVFDSVKSVDVKAETKLLVAKLKGFGEGEGTPLRSLIRSGRLGLNNALAESKSYTDGISSRWEEIVGTAKAHTAASLDKVGVEFVSFDDFRRKHPRLLIGGAVAVVAVPSMFAGKTAALRNSLMAATAAGGITYGVDWWNRRLASRDGGGGGDDDDTKPSP